MSHIPLLPSGRQFGVPFPLADDWTPEQALAVFELLDDLRNVIGQHYLHQIQEQMQRDRQTRDPDYDPSDTSF